MHLLLTAALLAATAAGAVRGVAPENQHLYRADGGTWRCLSDPSVVLTVDQINDNYCDCPDGSDEPGTNACAYTHEQPRMFHCANAGFRPAAVPNYKVNDGVCDYDVCCDGSDEYASGRCADRCAEVQAQYDAHVATQRARLREALANRRQLEATAAQLKRQVREQVERLRGEVAAAAASVARHEAAARRQRPAAADPLAFVADALAEQMSKVERTLGELGAAAAAAAARAAHLEAVLADLLANYNPNFNDQAVKQAVAAFANYASNKQEHAPPEYTLADFRLDAVQERLRGWAPAHAAHTPTLVPSLGNVVRYYYQRWWGGAAEAPRGAAADAAAPPASAELKQSQRELADKQADLAFYEKDLEQYPAEGEIVRALAGTWANKKLGAYTYKVGFLNAIYQDGTLLGRFAGMSDTTMHFAGGARCWNGPQRSGRVELVCGPHSELLSVSEPEKCRYRFVVATPYACRELSDAQIGESFVVDVGRLTAAARA